jgi:hypothetical protein
MLTDDQVSEMEDAVSSCEEARSALIEALDAAEEQGDEELQAVGQALETWRDAQKRFMEVVDASEVPDVSTAAMLLKTNHGVDSTEARRGLPGVHVDGADQPFDVDLSGTRGSVLTTAAMEYVSSD